MEGEENGWFELHSISSFWQAEEEEEEEEEKVETVEREEKQEKKEIGSWELQFCLRISFSC